MKPRRSTAIVAALVAAGLLGGGLAWRAADESDRPTTDGGSDSALTLELRSLDFRSLDGSGNHPDDPLVGAAFGPYARTAPARYADGVAEPVTHPPERAISNRVFDDLGENIHSSRGVTHWGYAWGQFVLHDMSRGAVGDEAAGLPLDTADPLERFRFDVATIPFARSQPGPEPDATGARTHVNELSSYLDGSGIYGTTPEQLDWLRAGPLDGDPTNNSPYLITDELLLPTAASRPNDPAPPMERTGRLRGDPSSAFIAGDARANENWPLTSLHTLFVREHNRIVAALPDDLLPEARFQIARRVVAAELQWITFQEYLPAMGVDLPQYSGFDPSVDPTITDEFATAAFRMHSQVHGELRLTDTYGGLSAEALAALAAEGITPTRGRELEVFIPLDVAFSNPALLREVGVDAILQALTWDVGYANDATIDDALRSVLFEMAAPGADPTACQAGRVEPTCFRGVVDLAAIDIARGYDHGLPTYNQLREAYGLERVTSFADLTGEATDELPAGMTIDDPDIMRITRRYDREGRAIAKPANRRSADVTAIERSTTTAARLRSLYGDVDDLDAFTGMQVEVRHPDSELGELQAVIVRSQFGAVRDGDRWFSDGDRLLAEIEAEYGIDYRRTLDEVVRDNARTLLQVPTTLFVG